LYCARLGEVFGTVSADHQNQLASAALKSAFDSLVGVGDRHLELGVVAPFFWIEPTSLYKVAPDTPAQANGFGALGLVGSGVQHPLFEDAEVVQDWSSSYAIRYTQRSSRTNMWLSHCTTHVRDGLGFIKPAQFLSDCFALTRNDPSEGRNRRDGYDGYNWTRGQSGFCAPAEAMYTQGKMVSYVRLSSFDETTFRTTLHHAPVSDEVTGSVTCVSSIPVRIRQSATNRKPRDVRCANTLAARALDNARSAWLSGFAANEGTLLFGEYDPNVLDDSEPRAMILPDITRVPPPNVGDSVPQGEGPLTVGVGNNRILHNNPVGRPPARSGDASPTVKTVKTTVVEESFGAPGSPTPAGLISSGAGNGSLSGPPDVPASAEANPDDPGLGAGSVPATPDQ
jgi:hypothetical protein